ncbi:MAG: GNAT family acetyltransferase [Parasphingopyxis sp.]|uniref:GNAT family acetyltransferase n=1 Tax=Parasphingopyxis sp. TaxID=1920299 RepID=UPI003FA01A55
MTSPPDTEIASATAADRDAVIALWRACGLTRPWNDPVADFDASIGNATSDILLLMEGDALIATVMVGFDGHRGWVYYLAVDPDRRREGLGVRMMDAAEAWLRKRGAPKIQLMVRSDNADVIAFYEALGLERQDVATLGRRLDDDGA